MKKYHIFLLLIGYILGAGGCRNEKNNASNLPREVFGIALGSTADEIKNRVPEAKEKRRGFSWDNPRSNIAEVYFGLSKGKRPALRIVSIIYDEKYSSTVSFTQFLSDFEKIFGSASKSYEDDCEFEKELVYWKDGKTRIRIGQNGGGVFFMTYEDLIQPSE